MESLLSVGQDVIIVVVGLILRFLAAVVGLALLLVPIVLVMMAWRKTQALRHHAAGLGEAGTLQWLRDAYYAPWHTWLAPAGAGLARVGLDSLAERLLPRITGIEVAAPGTHVRAGDPFARVTCGDRTLSLRAPADALVVKTNDEAAHTPQLLHREPYHRGWLAVVAPSEAFRLLRHGEPARGWLEKEEVRLRLSFEQALGYAAADGGDLVGSTPDLLPEERWKQVVQEFL